MSAVNSPIFVVGCFRSGTTLIERTLLAHPKIGGLGFETLLFTHLLPGRSLPAYNARKWEDALGGYGDVLDGDQLRADPLGGFTAIMERLQSVQGTSFWLEKTPFHLFRLEDILETFPDARFVYVLRDGRDVVTSIRAAPYILPSARRRVSRLVGACVLWEWFVCEGHRIMNDPSFRSRVMQLRFESMIRQPDKTLRDLDAFLTLDSSHQVMVEWLARAEGLDANSSFQNVHGLSPAVLDRWKNPRQLSPRDAELVNAVLRPTLELVGYDPVPTDRPSLARRVIVRLLRFAWCAARIASFSRNTGRRPPLRLFRRLLGPPCGWR